MRNAIANGFVWVMYRMSILVAVSSLVANLLPNAERLNKYPRLKQCYLFLIDYIAFFALNWRAQLPSLEQEMLGFRKHVKQLIQRVTPPRSKTT